ncbi:outer membrane protein [Maritalea sp. S77]|uniref:outer membrane protein n=1 Tax=Maritalea sp. S77 TaxID=3415125 RepID=UPI003C7C043D
MIKSMFLATTIVAAGTVSTLAADPIVYPTPTVTSSAFDWEGFYAGVGASGAGWSNALTVTTIDAIIGVNFVSGDYLYGLEGLVGYAIDSSSATGHEFAADARIGYLISPEAVIYASAGVGYMSLPDELFGTIGAGAEFALSDDVSLDFTYEHWRGNSFSANRFDASVNWHFN